MKMHGGGAGAGEGGECHRGIDHHAGAMSGDDEEELSMITEGSPADDGGGVVGGGDPGDGAIELISALGERSGQQGGSSMLARGGQLGEADGEQLVSCCTAGKIFLLQVGGAFEELPDSGFTLTEDERRRQALGGEFFATNELLNSGKFQAAILLGDGPTEDII